MEARQFLESVLFQNANRLLNERDVSQMRIQLVKYRNLINQQIQLNQTNQI